MAMVMCLPPVAIFLLRRFVTFSNNKYSNYAPSVELIDEPETRRDVGTNWMTNTTNV